MAHHMTNSERLNFESCRHKHFIQYVLGARAERISKALEMGSIFHDAMEIWWQHWKAHKLTALAIALRAMYQRFDDLKAQLPKGFSTSDRYDHMTQDLLERSRDMYGEILQAYHQRWQDQRLELLMNEEVLHCLTLTQSGHNSNRTGLAGKLDKLVRDEHGQIWIMDHKTTSRNVLDWRETNAYSPQLAQYAVMLMRQGIKPVGVVYDLVLKAVPPKPEAFKVLKNGVRLSKKLPRHADAQSYMAAIHHHGLDPSEPQHVATYEDMLQRQDPFFKREWIRFGRYELERAEQELYTVATEVRRQHDKGREFKMQLKGCQSLEQWQGMLSGIVREHGGRFPRSTGACYQYRRPCPLMRFCERPTPDTAVDLVPWQRDYTTANGLVDNTTPAFKEGK